MRAAVVAAIAAKLEADWDAAPLSWPNLDFTAPVDGPWVAVEILGAGATGTGIGSEGRRAFTADYLLWFHVYVPRGTGLETADALADGLAGLFRVTEIPAVGVRVVTGAPETDEGGVGDDAGLWWRLSVAVPVMALYRA